MLQRTRAHPTPSRSIRGALALLLASLWLASPARAGILTIDFDFATNSSLSILGGVINTPPDGAITSGTAQLRIEADDINTPITGGFANLASSNLAGFVSKNVQNQALVNGTFDVTQNSNVSGTLSAPNTITFSSPYNSNINANIGCGGTGCGALGLPINVSGNFVQPVQPVTVTDLEVTGAALISLNLPVVLDGVLADFSLVGVETGRSWVIPEPGTAALLGFGLLALARRRR